MALPHVNQTVPRAYVDLGTCLGAYARELVALRIPPVCTRSQVHDRVRADAMLKRHLTSVDLMDRALEFLASGGAVVLARNAAQSVILDPGWLAKTLACVITVNPERLGELPLALLQRGMLRHTPESLSMVWPEAKGYGATLVTTLPVRLTLLSLLYRFDLALELQSCGMMLACHK